MFGLNPMELAIVGCVALLLFGSKLPNVARSLGKSMMEFKKGVAGIQEEISSGGDDRPRKTSRYHEIDDRDEPSAPRFEPPRHEPEVEQAKEDLNEPL